MHAEASHFVRFHTTTDSVIYRRYVRAAVGRQYRLRVENDFVLIVYKAIFLNIILSLVGQHSVDLFSLYVNLKSRTKLQPSNTEKLLPSINYCDNVLFTRTSIGYLFCANIVLLIILILLSGDVHPNPGPDSHTSSISSSNLSTVFSHNLNIIHLNIQSILPKLDILEAEMQQYDILIFTETWLSPQTSNDDIRITNFDTPYRKDRQGRLGGGVAVYIRTGLRSLERHDIIIGDIEALCIEVSIQSHKLLLCGFYRPPNTGQDYWDLMEGSFDNLSNSSVKDLVIMGDFNCDLMKPIFASKIKNFAISYNLHQLIEEPTYYTENSASLIDLIFVSKPDNVIYSDVSSPFIPGLVRYHCPIIITLKFRKPKVASLTRHIWLYEKGDYIKYRRLLAQSNWEFISPRHDLNDIAEKVTETIINAAKQSIPNRTVTIKPHEPQWINSNIKRLIRQRKRLFKLAKRVNNEHAWNRFRQKRNAVTSIIRQAKKQYNESLANELKLNEHNSKLWYKISAQFLSSPSKPTCKTIPFLETENSFVETDTEIAEVLNNYFANQSNIEDSQADLPELAAPSYPLLQSIEITENDVKDAITSLKPNKAPGPNLVSPKLFKEAINEIAKPLKNLFKLSLMLKRFPDPWKRANLTAIHKKDDPSKPSNYRPISLLNYEGKLMERCVYKYLSQYLIQNSVISEFQSGFQTGDSTINQLTFLCNEFSKAIDDNKEIRLVFLDISKAFDKVWHRGLLAKLRAVGFSDNIVDWLSSYLNNRQQRVCLRGKVSSWKTINAGVPQGSILGPVLFLIFINDIVHDIRTNIRLFADDTMIYKIVHQPNLTAVELNLDLDTIKTWAKKWMVDFNPQKTKSLIISKKKQQIFHPILSMEQMQIEEVSQHKHLGITISDSFTWTKHIENMSAKAWKRIGSLRRYKFLIDRGSLFKMYTVFIRPLLEYGNTVWDNCSVENKRALENIQIEALRIVTGGTKVCSIQKLYDDTKCETLSKRRYEQKLCHLYKIINGATPVYLHRLLPPRVQQISRYPLRNSDDFSTPISHTVTYSTSFIPSTIRDWNALSQNIKDAQTLNSFKLKLKGTRNHIQPHFDTIQVSRIGQILHTRLRLRCSSLNQELFQKNLVSSPLCSCGSVETPSHFFFTCTKYVTQRQQHLLSLPHQLSLSLLLNGDPNESETVNNIIFKHAQLYILATKRFG